MQGKIYEIPLDISSGVLTKQIRELVTEDMGTNTFRFKVVRDNHVPYNFTGTIVRMMVKTPSGARVQQECTIENALGGTVSLILKQSLLLEQGSYVAELQIFDEITQSIRLTTPTFAYHVRESLQNSESIVATDEYTILQEALADLAGINIVVANKADKDYVDTIRDDLDAVTAQSNENATEVAKKANKIQEPWIAPTLVNGWTSLGGYFAKPGFYKDEFGIVHIKGMVKSGIDDIIFTLPTGYRPVETIYIPTIADDTKATFIQIHVDGTVSKLGSLTVSNWLVLNGAYFKVGA